MTESALNVLAGKLELIEALDGPAGAAAAAVRGLLPEDGSVKQVLNGAWLGHALHPILTDVPIGTWTSSILLDWIGGSGSHAAADRLLLIGVLATGAVVATGWSDWADAEGADPAIRRSGLVHAAANGTATAIMAGSWVARKRGSRGRGKLLSLGGSAFLGAGGWLGGHLSYTLGAGVEADRIVATA